jgi:hypothetical protein
VIVLLALVILPTEHMVEVTGATVGVEVIAEVEERD